ncbi:gamma-glutamyltransferase family protein [uncultured Desulfovibrio sp.]|uniref:gamma-glutamyltransferase family protein n=1 Tax=uncultured Desulfovibrio sp. TaxID=167968 RepID=UPI00220B6014|nr:gamma-glutamyltransferase family protein [uncultured Desulfovibrio sp.]CAI3238621.1 Gamma-glutamyltranspeptidase (EC @ Glutathione hydrolase (EC [Desulfovibrio diazotrophicus]
MRHPFDFDPLYAPHPSRRIPIYARNGMVAASSALASAAGLAMLRQGGNAVDAIVATAAALTVLEPTSNGLGSDAFALVWQNNALHGLNASGPAPQAISIEKVLARHGGPAMPRYGWTPVTVPGAVGAWAALSARFGKLPFATLLEPAIAYASEGYPVPPMLAFLWGEAFQTLREHCTGPEFAAWYSTFAPQGRAPLAGEIVRLPHHARSLQAIAQSRAEDFYRGDLAARIAAESAAFDGYLSAADLAAFQPQWVDPISVSYRGCELWEIPPNGQGITALMALNILKEFPLESLDAVEARHLQWEAMKLAFADARHYVTDNRHMAVDYHNFLEPAFGAARARQITSQAALPAPVQLPKGGTVYLCAADAQDNMVSYIQSNYMGFGSGIVVRDTGIALQNRGADFSLDPQHANCLQPGKKTYHTIIPAFITKGGRPIGPMGVMGAYMQPQGHVQVMCNLVDFKLNPQQALDAPRWQWVGDRRFLVEPSFPVETARQLAGKGHEVEVALQSTSFGRGQLILRLDNNVLVGAAEPRTDSNIACY